MFAGTIDVFTAVASWAADRDKGALRVASRRWWRAARFVWTEVETRRALRRISSSPLLSSQDARGLAINSGWLRCAVFDAKATDRSVIFVASRCPHVTVVRLERCERLGRSALRALTRHCPRLTSIDLSQCRALLTPESVQLLASARLVHLGIRFAEVTHALAATVVDSFPNLASLDLSRARFASARAWTPPCVWERLCSLRKLAVPRSVYLDKTRVVALARCFPQLRELDIAQSCYQLDNDALGAIATACPRLQRLDLGSCVWITNVGLWAVLAACPELRCVDITGCLGITIDARVELARVCAARVRSSSH